MNLVNEQISLSHVCTAIYDTKAEVMLGLSLARSSADFIRSVQVEAKNPQSMLHKFPADYDLFILGEWDEHTGIASTDKKRLGSVLDLCPLN